jgi:hypothetical protein
MLCLCLVRPGRAFAVVSMPMSMMEQVHQWTGKYEEVREGAEQVCPVLGKEEKACNEQKADQHPLATAGSGVIIRMCMVHRHLLYFRP